MFKSLIPDYCDNDELHNIFDTPTRTTIERLILYVDIEMFATSVLKGINEYRCASEKLILKLNMEEMAKYVNDDTWIN